MKIWEPKNFISSPVEVRPLINQLDSKIIGKIESIVFTAVLYQLNAEEPLLIITIKYKILSISEIHYC